MYIKLLNDDAGDPRNHIQGIQFNVDGTKMFTIYRSSQSDGDDDFINEYNFRHLLIFQQKFMLEMMKDV